jgi:F-type H+-transporting ATPase subunit delta
MIGGVAKRYARALYLIGEERRSLELVTSEIEALAATWSESDDFREVMLNPLFPMPKRRDVMGAIVGKLGVGDIARNAAMLLLDRARLPALPHIAKGLRTLADEREGKIRAEVVSAAPLSEPYFERLRGRLETITGRRVVLDRRVDPSLITGLVARVGDRLYDGSARTRLAELREALTES